MDNFAFRAVFFPLFAYNAENERGGGGGESTERELDGTEGVEERNEVAVAGLVRAGAERRGVQTDQPPDRQNSRQAARMFRQAARLALRQSGAFNRIAFSNTYRFQSTLSENEVLKRSIAVLKTFEIKTPEQPITMNTQFGRDLGMDSLDYNDALVALEEEFDVVFDDKVANEITTVGEAVEYIAKNHMPEEDLLDKEVR